MTHAWKLGCALAVVLVATGCASTPQVSTESSSSAIRAAEAVGADQTPLASLHLQLAKEELNGAQKLAADGKTEEAESLLLRAEADAELAILLSKEQSEQSEATQAMDRIRKIRSDNR